MGSHITQGHPKTASVAWQSAYDEGRRPWPDIELDRASFIAHLRRHHPDGDLQDVRLGDLYLAAACLAGHREALRVFERDCMSATTGFLSRMKAAPSNVEETAQRIRYKLLVGEGRARLADYAGRGALTRWVRVAAMRLYFNMLRDEGRLVQPGDERLVDVIGATAADAEVAMLRRRYGAEFRSAFTTALENLSAAEKNLLRLRFVDGLNVSAIATMQGVHRATIHRRIAQTCESLAQQTEKLVCEALAIDGQEMASIRRMIQSQLAVSIGRVLSTECEGGSELR